MKTTWLDFLAVFSLLCLRLDAAQSFVKTSSGSFSIEGKPYYYIGGNYCGRKRGGCHLLWGPGAAPGVPRSESPLQITVFHSARLVEQLDR